MLLSQIQTDPERYQFRDKPYSEATVNAIVAEGIDLAKFDPLPLIDAGGSVFIVGGDGHSRWESIRRLAEQSRLPEQWTITDDLGGGVDYDIPHKLISADDANRLSFTANLSRDDFTPSEEARIYQRMIDDGMTTDAIATLAHKSAQYVRRMLPLNSLAACIREQIGKSVDAGGIDKTAAIELAAVFAEFSINTQLQQQLYHEVLKAGDVTPSFVRGPLRTICRNMAGIARESQGGLFILPPNVAVAVAEVKARAKQLQRAITGLQSLIGVADVLPDELRAWLDSNGQGALMQLKYESDCSGATVFAQAA